MGAIGTVIVAFARPLARWLVDSDEIVDLTVDFVWVIFIVSPAMAVEFAFGGALRGAGDTRFPLIVILTGLFLFRMIPAYIGFSLFDVSIQAIWATLILDYYAKSILFIWRFRGGAWQQIQI